MDNVLFNSLQLKHQMAKQEHTLFLGCYKIGRQWSKIVLSTVLVLLWSSSVVLAQDKKPNPQEVFINPLEITTPDPLLPKVPKGGTLTPEQEAALREKLDEFNTQAAALLQQEKPVEAFELWYRELRLRRALGPLEEVRALGRVGEIAWQRNQRFDVQVITQRLQAIQQDAVQKKTLNLELLQALGQSYQQVRFPGPAIAIYQQILADARQKGDAETEMATLKTLGQLQLAWFDYPSAATTYEQLLAKAQQQGDRVNELIYLQELINIYNKAKEPQNALQTKQRLVENYLNQNDYTKVPALKIAIGEDYEALNQPEDASQTYQEAYSLAFSLQQFAYASDALEKLAQLYINHDQSEFAFQVYEVLLKVDQQSYDYYGLMNTYDKIGQLYLKEKNYSGALTAFQQGLALAQSLKYQETYFTRQIELVNQQGTQSNSQ
ncbi:MAG TPA: hypothetical protein V6D33_16065 [Cyanophyceae cyanobacterium]